MLLKRTFGFILIAAIALALSYSFNFFILHMSERAVIEQVLMVFLLACALGTIFFFTWIDGITIRWKPDVFRFDLHAIRDNLPGILLAIAFTMSYLYFGRTFNNFGVSQVDNLFDADIGSWVRRISSSDVQDFEMRGPHPFTYFIFQPFGHFLNIFTQDLGFSAILFNTLTGGACVFLMWLFVKRQFGSKIYAFLMAILLGASASHFFFGSVVETYIFSSFALLLFLLILQSKDSSIFALAAGGVLTFGITLTNFIQNFLAFFIVRPRLREIIRFAGWSIAISLVLTYLHAALYPASKLFFLATDLTREESFFLDILQRPEWFVVGRLMYLLRTVLFYSMVAPKVFILTEEVGSTLPEFRFYKISVGTFHLANYDGLGQIIVAIWAFLLAVSGIVFLWRLIRTRKLELTFSLLLCLLFNFFIHMNYGQELFLYSLNWSYALTLFVAFGLAPFAKNRFFQVGLSIFLVLLIYHQWQFMNIILDTLEQLVLSTG